MKFKEWLKLREDFGQGIGATGACLPLKPKQRKRKINLTQNPTFRIDHGQSYQGTRKDDGNG